MAGETSDRLGGYLDSVTSGISRVYGAINPPRAPRPAAPAQTDYKPWIIGGGIVLLALVVVGVIFGRK
jgi:hypothetical protein